ncbi:MAG: SRPBCC family protein, partial [Methylocystis sp.]
MTFVLARRAFAVAALSLLSAGMLSGSALAHGPSRQKVVEKIEIDAPAAKVWEIIGNFQDLSWHPGVAKTEGTGGNAVDAKRKLTLKNGGVIDESLTKYDADGKSMSYKIDAVDVKV